MNKSITARLRKATAKYGVCSLPVQDIKAVLEAIFLPERSDKSNQGWTANR